MICEKVNKIFKDFLHFKKIKNKIVFDRATLQYKQGNTITRFSLLVNFLTPGHDEN